MADTTKKPSTGGTTPKGGNTPKPPATNGPSQSAKDKSRAQSRPVSAKAPSGKGGAATGKGGNTPRPGGKAGAATASAPRANRTALITWGAVGLVVVIVAVLIIVKVTSNGPANLSYTPVTPAPASVVHDVTNIPLSVYNTVGVTSSTAAVTPPTIIKGKPPLSIGGKSPAMLYIGAEYCPYCAAERWGIAAALSRFGTWSGLQITASSYTDVDAQTHTFSFVSANLTSPYLTFVPVEAQSNVPLAAGGYANLEKLTTQESQDYATLAQQYVQGYQPGSLSYPFVNIGNVALISGPSYDPGILAGLTWTEIAGGLSDPTNPVTQAIVSTANYISASVCASTKGQPGDVCTSSGVKAAAKSMGISAS